MNDNGMNCDKYYNNYQWDLLIEFTINGIYLFIFYLFEKVPRAK